MKQRLLITFLSLCLLMPGIQAQSQTIWRIDTVHSSVQFKVTHMIVSSVTGNFRDFNGTLKSPKAKDFKGSSVNVTIKTASIHTDNVTRDKHLRDEDFFAAGTYPTITFVSKSFTEIAENKYLITGDLTIRDVTKPVELIANYKGSIEQSGKILAGFEASGTINRFDFGLQWDDTLDSGSLVVGEKVDIILNIKLTRDK